MNRKILKVIIMGVLLLIASTLKNSVLANSNFDYNVKIPNEYKVINSSYTDDYEMATYDNNSETFFRVTVYDKKFLKNFSNGNMWFSSWLNINQEDMYGFTMKCLENDEKIIERNNDGYKVRTKELTRINGFPARRILAVGPSGYTVDVYQIVSNNYFAEIYFFSKTASTAKSFTDSQTQKSILNSFKFNNDSASNCENILFKDVSSTEWYCNAIKYVSKNGIMNGYDSVTFAPNDKLTRAMVVSMLYKMEGQPKNNGKTNFTDVNNSEWYAQAIKWATDKGIVHGYGGTKKFGPNDNILRQDLAGILRNYAKYKGKAVNVTADLTKFSDYKKVDSYAETAVKWAVGKGVITGNTNGTLAPKGNATRAEAAAMIQKYCNKVGK